MGEIGKKIRDRVYVATERGTVSNKNGAALVVRRIRLEKYVRKSFLRSAFFSLNLYLNNLKIV